MSSIVERSKELVPDSQILFHDAAVKNQNDLGNVTLPRNNCLVITMAAQVNYNSYYQVHIDERLFNHKAHSRQSKATLILHELLYAYGRKNFKHNDSGATRSLIRYYISYHDSITEGSTSTALVDLNFHSGQFLGDVDFASRYILSQTMVQYGFTITESSINIANDMLNNFVLYNAKAKGLYYDLILAADSEGWAGDVIKLPNMDKQSFYLLKNLVYEGLRRGKNEITWKSFNERLLEINKEYIQFTQLRVDAAIKSAINPTMYGEYVSPEQFKILEIGALNTLDIFLDFAYQDIDGAFPIEDLVKYAEFKMRKEVLSRVFFVTRGPVCDYRGNGDPESIPVGCLGPLKLDHIIPKA